MPTKLLASAALSLFAPLCAQTTATVPPFCETLPGNAAISMPLRWSEGIVQVWVDPELLPANFVGETITGLRLRRSTLADEVAYGPLQRTITVRGGFQSPPAVTMIGGVTANRPPGHQVLFGPAPVAIAPTAAPSATTTTGDEFVRIVFSQPLLVAAGTLFLEFEASDGPLQIGTEHWVDAVWFQNGVDQGYVARVGDGSCTTRMEPTELRWTSSSGPLGGTTGQLELTGAPPTNATSAGFVMMWVGQDPETTPPAGIWLGFGGSFAVFDPALAGCHMWSPFDVTWGGVTDAGGRFATPLDLPATLTDGQRFALQAAWLDPSRPGLPISVSSGLQLIVNSADVGDRCNTIYFPGTTSVSPWQPFVGQMPVLVLEY